MNFINHKQVESKVVVFEPGNATRYYFTLTKSSDYNMVAVDMNNQKIIEFSPKFSNEEHLVYHIQSKGYSIGDARPIAEHLIKAIQCRNYFLVRGVDEQGGVEYHESWVKDEAVEDFLVSCGEEGYTIMKQATIWR